MSKESTQRACPSMELREMQTFKLDVQIGSWKGKVDITVAPLDDRKFYLGMDFLDKARASIVPHASTLFIMADGQVHPIPMRRDAEKEKVLPALQFSIHREAGHLAALKRDEGAMCAKASTRPGRKQGRRNEPEGRQDASTRRDNVPRGKHRAIPTKCKRHHPGARGMHAKTRRQRGRCRVWWGRMSRDALECTGFPEVSLDLSRMCSRVFHTTLGL